MTVSKRLTVTLTAAALCLTGAARAQLLIVGNDEKVTWDADGKIVVSAPGKDSVSILDIRDRAHPRVVASLPITNSVVGPPTNVAITPNGHLALVANSLEVVAGDGGAWRPRTVRGGHGQDRTGLEG